VAQILKIIWKLSRVIEEIF